MCLPGFYVWSPLSSWAARSKYFGIQGSIFNLGTVRLKADVMPHRNTTRMDYRAKFGRSTTVKLVRNSDMLNLTRKQAGRNRSEKEMNHIFKDDHYRLDGFNTGFRGRFPVVRFTLKN